MSLQSTVPLVLSVLGSDRTGKRSRSSRNHPNGPAADNTEPASLAVSCLSKLLQIDHDLILKDIPRILPALLHVRLFSARRDALLNLCQIPDTFPSIIGFLELLLDYHVKTRTMHTHIETLFAALETHLQKTDFSDVHYRYRCAFSSALLHPIHLKRLANCTGKFLTPGQTGQTVTFILETLQASWTQISASTDAESSNLALTFCFSARLASIVLTALPLQALPGSMLEEVNHSINEIRNAFLPRALTKMLKIIRKNASDSWASQVMAAAILRLQYALDTPYTEKLWAKVVTALEQDLLLPELNLELVCRFLVFYRWPSTVILVPYAAQMVCGRRTYPNRGFD
jgi:hypothetical protein